MAEIVIYEVGKVFTLKMSDEDMEQLTELCTTKKHNYFDVVIACFHAGLVALTLHLKCCQRHPNDQKRCQNLLPKQETNKSGS